MTKQELSEWFDDGVANGCTHMIVVCDSFSYEEYPVYVYRGENAKAKAHKYDNKEMQRVMEVYNLSKDKQCQLASARVFNY